MRRPALRPARSEIQHERIIARHVLLRLNFLTGETIPMMKVHLYEAKVGFLTRKRLESASSIDKMTN